MNKQAYLAQLKELLAPLPEPERQDALNYYEEYFDAAGPDVEDATAAELGDPAEAARKILEGEGLTLDATSGAAGEKASPDAAGSSIGRTAPCGSTPPAGDGKNTAHHSPAAIPPAVGVLVVIAAVLIILIIADAFLFGVHRSSSSTDARTEIAEADVSSEEPFQENTADSNTGDSAAESPKDNNPRTMEIVLESLSSKDAVLDLDYGRLTIAVDSGAGSAVLHGENVRPDFFSIDQTENRPLSIRYKTPANYDLSQDPEPEFVLTVPDTFQFKSLSIRAAMGDIAFDDSKTITADKIDLDLAMGNFNGGTVQAGSFTADVSMGNFNLALLQGAAAVDVQAAMGYIGLTVDGKPEDYTIDLQSDMGEIAFNGQEQGSRYTQNTGADRRVTLAAAMGDVVLTTTR